jgi:hypothetical protein
MSAALIITLVAVQVELLQDNQAQLLAVMVVVEQVAVILLMA